MPIIQPIGEDAAKTNRSSNVGAADWPTDCDKDTGFLHKCGSAISKLTTIGVLTERYQLGAPPSK